MGYESFITNKVPVSNDQRDELSNLCTRNYHPETCQTDTAFYSRKTPLCDHTVWDCVMDRRTVEERLAHAMFMDMAFLRHTTDPPSRGYEMNGVRSMDTQ